MERNTSLNKANIADLVPGELFRHSFGADSSLLLFLREQEDGRGIVGVISSSAFKQPMMWHSMRREGACLSYGTDWFLEEIHGRETACGLSYTQQTASLFIDDGGPVMSFLPGGGHEFAFRKAHFNVLTNEEHHLSNDAAPILAWRIWESSAHFDRADGPLFEMPVAQA